MVGANNGLRVLNWEQCHPESGDSICVVARVR